MADIELTCSTCGNVITVSEFADHSGIVCNTCGSRLAKADTADQPQTQTPLAMKLKTKKAEPASQKQAPIADNSDVVRAEKMATAKSKSTVTGQTAGSWVLFIALGGFMGYARYGGNPSINVYMGYVQLIAPYVVIAFIVLVVLKAFKDSIFQGTLCLLVPFYWLYYLFSCCDDYYLRATITGLLVGIGEDSGREFQRWAGTIVRMIEVWIESGGGDVR